MVRGVCEVSGTVGTLRACLAADDGQCAKFVTPWAAKPLICRTASPHRPEGKCYKVFLELLIFLFMFQTGIASIDRSTATGSSSPQQVTILYSVAIKQRTTSADWFQSASG